MGRPIADAAALSRLMLVWGVEGGQGEPDPFATVERAVAGGLRLLQLRAPQLDQREHISVLEALRARFPELMLFVNRRDEVAMQLRLGLHLPECEPLPPGWPSELVWGRSVHDVAAARRAEADGARYLVLGTIYPTTSKPGHPGSGPQLVRQVAEQVSIPVYAIGGIEGARVTTMREVGAHGIAVRRAIIDADDPCQATRDLFAALAG